MSQTPLVIIEWEDSAQPIPSWLHLSDFTPGTAVSCVSVGWLIQDDKKVKALAPNMGEFEDENQIQASGIIRIPTCSVTRIAHLHEGEDLTSVVPLSRPDQALKRKPS